MKLLSRLVWLVALFVVASCANNAGTEAQKAESHYTVESARVEEVLHASDKAYKNISYVVIWNGSRVNVADPLSTSAHQVGDTVWFMAQRFHLQGTEVNSLNFLLTEPPATK